ncbi:hypothetical protein OEZ86_009194 [Tetradesmus obliquus]|nr:hypothetical protein OEZ86_009194 [Tetradesmus obliquus]
MSQEEGNEHTPSATPSRSGSSGSGDEASGSPATQNEACEQHAGPLLPHQLIPAHIKDKEKVDVRRGMLKTATKELGALLQSFQSLQESSSLQDSSSSSEELAAAVLCSKLMKRRTLLCCKADPQQPDTRPLRPLQVLCEAKELLTFLTQDTSTAATDLSSHMWYCLFCEQQLPGAPLRGCDACPMACHGACYTRTYGQPLAQGPDGRVLCLSCQDASLRVIKDASLRVIKEPQAAAIPASKAGTASYTVPAMANEVFRRETNPCHFEKGTYDFWGPKQAKLMDALVLPVDSPEALAAAAAAAAGDEQQQQQQQGLLLDLMQQQQQ